MNSTENHSATTSAAGEPALADGQKLAGCYLLRRRVETGDATVVWLAHDEVLGKDISLHFLPAPVRADTRAMEEIRKEVKRNRQLIHPHILRVHDFVEEPDFAAVAMDTFEGESLASLLKKRGHFEPGAIQPWIGSLCQTLEDAHKINLIHRDLAPANLFLSESGKLLVASFGIGRCVQDAIGRVTRGSNPRLAYMSPQLADGQPATRTDDVYSLGMLLFELLTGELPFNGGDVVSQIRRVAAPRVSARLASGRKTVELPASWDETIAAALRKDAAQRPATALEVASRLEAVAVKEYKPGEAVAPAPVPQKAGSRIAPATKPAAPQTLELGLEAKPAEAKPTEAKPVEAKSAEPVKLAPMSESPAKKAVDILRERAEELKRSKIAPPPAAPPAQTKPESAASRSESKVTPPPVPPAKTPAKKEESNIFPLHPPQRSRLPALGLAAGITLLAVGVGGYFVSESNQQTDASADETEIATTEQTYGSEIRSVNNPGEVPPPSPNPEPAPPIAPPKVAAAVEPVPKPTVVVEPAPKVVIAAPPVEAITPPPVKAAPPKPEVPKPEILLAAQKPPTRAAAPAPAPAPAPPPAAAPIVTEQALAEKLAAVERLKQAAQAAEQAHQDLLKQQQQAESAAMETQKALEQKTKDAAPIKKASEDLAKARKQREDAQKAADLEAQEAQRMAAEKAQRAEAAKKALADFEAQNKDKLAAQEKADAELSALQKTLAEKQLAAAAVTKAITDASAARQQQLAAVKQAEQEADQTKMLVAKAMAAETARREREAAEKFRDEKAKERGRIEVEIAAMKKLFEEKLKVLEAASKAMSDAEARTRDTEAVQKRAEEEALKLLSNPGAPAGGKPSVPDKAPAPEKPTAKLIPSDAPPTPEKPAAPAATPAATLAMKTDPTTKPTTPPAPEKPAQGTGLPENSLGMKFAPVGDVEFGIWQTRVADFDAFARAVNLRSNAWKGPGFKQGIDHPVVNVTWLEAVAFCKWLTEKERKEGSLPASQVYRLPTDAEWSKAVGLPDESGKTPEARDMGIPDVYPWGNQWPPPAGAGNYTGEETGSDVAIKGYDDGFAWTSPVGSFPSNKYGLYDMGGNVWQWVMDTWNNDSKHKVLRGASWYNGALKLSLLSSCRVHAAADSSTDNYGFRVVRVSETAKSARR